MSENVSGYNRLLEVLNGYTQSQSPANSNMIFGTVMSVEPLAIKLDNMNETLPADFFFLGQMCRPHKVTIPHKHEYNGQTEQTNDGGQGASPHQHEIKQQVTEDLHIGTGGYQQDYVVLDIYPTLAVGDKVLLFSFADGQKYYVAERLEQAE